MAQAYADEINVAIKASASGFKQEFQAAGNVAKQAANDIGGAFGGLNGKFDSVAKGMSQSFAKSSSDVAASLSQTSGSISNLFGSATRAAESSGKKIEAVAATMAANSTKAIAPLSAGMSAAFKATEASAKQAEQTVSTSFSGIGRSFEQGIAGAIGVKGAMVGVGAAAGTAGKSVSDAGAVMSGSMAQVTTVIDKLKAPFLAIAGILSGGALFAGAVAAAANLAREVGSLAKMTGMSASEAAVLNEALHDAFLSGDDYGAVIAGITRQVNNQGNAFDEMGVKVKDAKGNLLSYDQIIQNSIGVLKQYKEGVDRNAAAQALYSRSWEDVLKLAKLTPAAMEEARRKLEAYGIQMGPDKVADAKKYRQSMQEVKDMFENVAVVIGQSLMPKLTEVARWFSDTGPTIVNEVRGIVAVFAGLAQAIVAVFTTATTLIGNTIAQVQNGLQALAAAGAAVRNLSASGVIDAAKQGAKGSIAIFKDAGQQVVSAWKDVGKVIGNVLGLDRTTAGNVVGATGGKSFKGLADKSKSGDTNKAEQQFAAAQAEAMYRILKDGLDRELEALNQANADKLVSIQKYYADSVRIQQAEIDARIAATKKEMDATARAAAAAPDYAKRLGFMSQLTKLNADLAILEKKRGDITVKAAHDMKVATQEYADMLAKVDADRAKNAGNSARAGVIELEKQYRDMLKTLRANGDAEGEALVKSLINVEMYKRQFSDVKAEYDRIIGEMNRRQQTVSDKLSSGAISSSTAERENNKIRAATRKEIEVILPLLDEYALKSESPDIQEALMNIRQEWKGLGLEINATGKAIQDSFESNTATMFESFMTGSKSAKQAFSDLAKGIVQDIDRIVAKKLAEQLFEGFGGGAGGGGGGFGSMIGSFFSSIFSGGAAANGGYVFAGKPTMVGENGREMFMPTTSGQIISADQLNAGGGGVNVTMNVATRDASSFSYSNSQIASRMATMMMRARSSNRTM